MKKKMLIFTSIILAVLLFGYMAFFKTNISKNLTLKYNCMRLGGEWSKGGLAQTYTCVRSYSDGGKQCGTSNDCLGDCVVTNYKNPDPHCDYDDSPYGCKASIEDFKKTGSLLCTD